MSHKVSELTEQELELYVEAFSAGRNQMLKQILKLIDTKTYHCQDCDKLGDICPMDLQKNAWWSFIKFMTYEEKEEKNES